MRIFFYFILLCLVFTSFDVSTNLAYAQETNTEKAKETVSETKTTQESEPVVDLNAPAPPSPFQIRIPHSERTKSNLLDSTVEFLFSTFVKRFEKKDVYFSYEFFEIEPGFILCFKNFNVDVKRKDATGNLHAQNLNIAFSDFVLFLKEKTVVLGKITLQDFKLDLELIEKKATRKMKAKAKEVVLNHMRLISFHQDVAKEGDMQNTTFSEISILDGNLSLSEPKESYQAKNLKLLEVLLPQSVIKKMSFSSATANNKTFHTMGALLNEIKK